MKKTLLALAVLMAFILVTSCPSEPNPTKKVDKPDMVFKGGKYQYNFDTPRIEHGKTYEVLLTLTEWDEDFTGSQLGGKICYKMDLNSDDEKVLSGWNTAVPTTVSIEGQYKWTFIAGNKHSDTVAVEKDATTPEGGKQYFSFTAQKDNKDLAANISFGIKGKFEVKEKQVVTNWVTAGELTLGNESSTAGKGAFSEDDMKKIDDLVAQYPLSIIRFTIHVPKVGDGGANIGYGVVGVGGWETNNSMSIPVPSEIDDKEVKNGDEITFTHDLEIADIKKVQNQPGYQIAVNPYNTATVTKAELFRPGP